MLFLLCIEFVILLIEEKVMSYVTVSQGHGYPLVYIYILKRFLILLDKKIYFEKAIV
jgi:hypothetical protein